MATLVLGAIGTLVGGPLGGSIGALLGRQLDARILGPGNIKGPRLKELAVTTSSYGSPVPRHYGRMRIAGSIIWATDLVEHKEKHGGGKGRPKTVSYSYTSSFAVALASRPILGIGRIWADGNLLRGANGDLKTGGTLRVYTGEADQLPDPLIEAAEGSDRCPAFRGMAYAVFEDLELGDFGNRIPTLSFEVVADEGVIDLARIISDTIDDIDATVDLPGLSGFSLEGPVEDALSILDQVYPLDCDACGESLAFARGASQALPITLPEAAISVADGDFGGNEGRMRKRQPAPENGPETLRYYDIDRDYQPGIQRASGRPGPGQPQGAELPAALTASAAKVLVEDVARREKWARETLSWRTSELDPAVAPGVHVSVPGEAGRWCVTEWEWRATGVELGLLRLPPASGVAVLPADSGRAGLPVDLPGGASQIFAYELPWDGVGSGDTPIVFAAVSSAAPGWSGASLYIDHGNGELISLSSGTRRRATIGTSALPLVSASPHLFDRSSELVVTLQGADTSLADATTRQLSAGANRALVGNELIQFASAVPLGGGQWRLAGLLRGRGGTEGAIAGHGPNEAFVLLDDAPVLLDPAQIGSGSGMEILAIGTGDSAPSASSIALLGATTRPLTPVHPRARTLPDGTLALSWTRRARGAWLWPDGVDAPLQEQTESYQVAYGPVTAPLAIWQVSEPRLNVSATLISQYAAALPGGSFHVRQQGSFALSDPLYLASLA